MKRFITYIYIIAVSLIASVSCTREDVFEGNGQDGFITLRLQTAEMGTRVTIKEGDPVDGEDLENFVDHADFFFFKNEDGTELLDHKRLTVKTEQNANGELVPVEGQDNLYECTFDVSSTNNDGPLQGPSYVYVIANYPEEIDDDEITSLDDVLGLDIPIDLSEDFEYFVMDSYDSAAENRLTYLTPSKGHDNSLDKEGNVKYTIGLSRAAAKLVLSFKVAKSYTDAASNYWTPVTNQMWWNFLYVRKSGMTVEAEPLAFDAKTNYFNTEQLAPVENEDDEDDEYTYWTTSAIYTYPQAYKTDDRTAPYYKLFCPWTCEKKGMNNFYYKIILPDLNVDEKGNNFFKRNKVYQLMVDVSVIGGTEEDWALLTDHIYVADWWAPEKIEASFEGAMYLDVPVTTFTIYGDDSVTIPVVSSNLITVTGVTGTRTNLYSGSTESVTPSITNITKEGFTLTHELNTDMTSSGFDCTPITYTMTVNHASGGLNKPITVTVIQYPSIYVEAQTSNGSVFVNGQGYNSSYNVQGTNAYFTPVFDNQESSGSWYGGYLGNIGSVANPSSVNGQGDNNNQHQYTVHVSVLPSTNPNVIGDPRGGSAVNNLGYATYSFSSGSPQYSYYGDYYHRRYFSSTADNNVSTKYNPAGDDTQNTIAPIFKIASSYGKTTLMNYTYAKERCAAYQENGYPAGRWRLPTSAEIDFVISLSENNHIPTLFGCGPEYNNNGSFNHFAAYWSGGGWAYCGKTSVINGEKQLDLSSNGNKTSESGTNYTVTVPTGTNTNYTVRYNNTNYTHYVYTRCVYDVWYWGDGQDSAHMTTWGGYQMD